MTLHSVILDSIFGSTSFVSVFWQVRNLSFSEEVNVMLVVTVVDILVHRLIISILLPIESTLVRLSCNF